MIQNAFAFLSFIVPCTRSIGAFAAARTVFNWEFYRRTTRPTGWLLTPIHNSIADDYIR